MRNQKKVKQEHVATYLENYNTKSGLFRVKGGKTDGAEHLI